MTNRSRPRIPLLMLALGSGCAALLYEAVWLRWFRVLFGSTAYAASATLCAFFAGMAIGAAVGGRLSARVRSPLRAYAAIEAGTALTALLVPLALLAYEPLYAAMYNDWVGQRSAFTAVKFALAFVAVLPTSALLGATLPMLATAFVGSSGRLTSRGGGLYAVNTFGAAAGSALGALWLPEKLGVQATYGCAMALSLAVAASSLWLSHSRRSLASSSTGSEGTSHDEASTRVSSVESVKRAPLACRVVAFGSGFGTLALEVLLIHAIALSLENSVYSFGAVLIVVLLALGTGAAVVAFAAARVEVRNWLGPVLWVQAAMIFALPFVIVTGTGGMAIYRSATFLNGFVLALAFGGLPFLLGGLVLPLTFRRAEDGSADGVGRRLGGLLAANTLGGIVGSAAASFVLLDWFGLWNSMVAIAGMYAFVAVWLADDARARSAGVAAIAVLVGCMATGTINPGMLPVTKIKPRERVVAMKEGAHGIVTVVEVRLRNGPPDRRLRIDGSYTLSGALARQHQKRLGHLPLVLHGGVKRALFIGTATGETASASVTHPVEEIVLVELVPEVQEFAALHFAEANAGVYTDPRTRVVVEDGRNHVRAVPELYDAMVTDLLVPWRPGVGSLYTREHFEAAKAHLSPGGVFCLWLPIYQLDADLFDILSTTMLEVFPNASLWRGDFFAGLPTAALIAFNGPPPTRENVEASVAAARKRGLPDRWIADPDGIWALHIGALAAATYDRSAVQTDDQPIFEYVAARSTGEKRERFRTIDWPSRVESVLRDPASVGVMPTSARRREAALALAVGFRLIASSDPAARERGNRLLRTSVPTALLESPDVTVAERWPGAVHD